MCTTLKRLARQAALVFCCCIAVQCGVIYPTVRWCHSNPMFQKNVAMFVQPYSKITLECPNPATVLTQQAHSQSRDNMYENIWLVDKQGYDSCTVNDMSHRLLKKCDTPSVLNYLEIVFQLYTPLASGLKFDRGKEYYVISTSSGTRQSLQDKSGGRCRKNNMRLKFYICNGANDPKCQDPTPPTSNTVRTVSKSQNVLTVTKTVTVCSTMDSSVIQPESLIRPTPSSSSTVSTAHAQATPIRFKYATLLPSLGSSSVSPSTISPSASQSQTCMSSTAALP